MTNKLKTHTNIAREVQRLGRREFLKVSGVATALAASGVVSLAPAAATAKLPEGINHMTVEVYAIWHKLMKVLLPTDGSSLVDPETLPVLQTVDGAFLATMPPPVREGLFGGVAFFNSAPEEAFGKPFVDLTSAEAVQFCDDLASSDNVEARALFRALMFLTVTAYWAIPPAWQPLGFQGPVSDAWGLEYIGNQPLPTK